MGGVSLNPGPPVTGPGGFVVAVPRVAVYSRALSTAELRAVLDVERNRDLNSFLLSIPAGLEPYECWVILCPHAASAQLRRPRGQVAPVRAGND